MDDRALVGRLFVASYAGTAAPIDLVRRFRLGGVIAMAPNIESVAAARRANARLAASAPRRWPLIIAVDQEGGLVSRLGRPMTQFPTQMSFGAARSPRLARRVGRAIAQELRAAGFTMDFAPDA